MPQNIYNQIRHINTFIHNITLPMINKKMNPLITKKTPSKTMSIIMYNQLMCINGLVVNIIVINPQEKFTVTA